MNVHQQHQGLHGDHVDPLAMEPRHLQHFEVCDAQHHERQQEGERVERDGEDDELCPAAGATVGQRARGVQAVVAHPREAGGHRREGRRVRPRVAKHKSRVPAAHLGVVPQRKDHGDPAVDAERRHTQHGVGGQESLQEARQPAKAVSTGLSAADQTHQCKRHVGDGEQQVAEGEVEGEECWRLPADLRAVQQTDQHHHVGEQRHGDNRDHERGEEHLGGVHPARSAPPRVRSLIPAVGVHVQSVDDPQPRPCIARPTPVSSLILAAALHLLMEVISSPSAQLRRARGHLREADGAL